MCWTCSTNSNILILSVSSMFMHLGVFLFITGTNQGRVWLRNFLVQSREIIISTGIQIRQKTFILMTGNRTENLSVFSKLVSVFPKIFRFVKINGISESFSVPGSFHSRQNQFQPIIFGLTESVPNRIRSPELEERLNKTHLKLDSMEYYYFLPSIVDRKSTRLNSSHN